MRILDVIYQVKVYLLTIHSLFLGVNGSITRDTDPITLHPTEQLSKH